MHIFVGFPLNYKITYIYTKVSLAPYQLDYMESIGLKGLMIDFVNHIFNVQIFIVLIFIDYLYILICNVIVCNVLMIV